MLSQKSINGFLLTIQVLVCLCFDSEADPRAFRNVFGGQLVPVFTPFDKNGNLNTSTVPVYANFLAQCGVTGVIVAATDGEGFTINLEERKRLLNAWISAARPLGLTVIMQIGWLPIRDLMDLTRYSYKLGADAIIVLPSTDQRPLVVDEGVRGLKAYADAVPDMPVFYHDDPLTTRVDLNMALFFNQSTALISNFAGIRLVINVGLQVVAANTLNKYQILLISNHDAIEAAFLLRFGSSVSIATSVFPDIAVGMEVNVGTPLATELQDRLSDIVDAVVPNPPVVSLGPYVTGIKCAFEIVTGIEVGSTRPPFEPITQDLKTNVTRILQNLGVTLVNPTY